ncbi:MAG: tRNA (adenosine(37)-N6)-threonylcarbamoyltransferase complex transferase subunit TsaD, partial [Chlamydiia bacterium]|nr:tRNA (adenosine(37)-N6)-threonylcarbamoyltransferase complex transferase subunit TsaD [Chlamydiia bacterium]
MKVLGIETSCDETAVAVVEDGKKILVNLVASQAEVHEQYGGVFPEIASRHHIDRLLPLVEQALALVGEIDRIAVANGPGLM